MSKEKDLSDLDEVINNFVKEIFEHEGIKEISKGKKITYNFTLKSNAGPSKKPKEFKIPSKPKPLFDVMDEGKNYRILLEVPESKQDKVNLRVSEYYIEISFRGFEGNLEKTAEFNHRIDVNSLKSSYNNGILELIVLKN